MNETTCVSTRCKNVAVLGKSKCRPHRKYAEQYRAKVKVRGTCTGHANVNAVRGKTKCEKCLNTSRRNYIKAKRDNLCVCCRKNTIPKNKSVCSTCLWSGSIAKSSLWAKMRYTIFKTLGNKCYCCGDERYKFLTLSHLQILLHFDL